VFGSHPGQRISPFNFYNKTQKIIKINLPPPKVNIEPEHDGHDGSENDIALPVVHYTSGVYNN